MDAFVEKIKEYGIKLMNTNGLEVFSINETLIRGNIKGSANNKLYILENLFIYFVVNNKHLLAHKIGIDEDMKKGSPFLLENTQLVIHNKKDRWFSLEENYEKGKTAFENVLNNMNENEKYYATRYPDWTMKKVFNKKEADKQLREVIVDELYDEQFGMRDKEYEGLKQLYDELVTILDEMDVKQKNEGTESCNTIK